MGQMRKATALAAVAVLALGISACGDDDDDDTAAEGETAAFCDALVEFNGAVLASEVDDTSSEDEIKAAGEELGPMFATIAENAPDELSDTAEELNGTVQGLRDGDAEAFASDETFQTYTEFVAASVEECDFDTVDVTGVDYAFEGVPESIPAGVVSFNFENGSETEEHEMLIVRKVDGVTLSWEEIANASEEESESMVEFKGAAFAPPGETSGTIAELDAGEYAMLCFVPVGGSEDGPPHFTQGMIQEFTVE